MKNSWLGYALLLGMVFAQNVFSQTVDATGQWTYAIDTQSIDCSLVEPPGAGTLTISQVGNQVTVVNETYNKTYTGTVNQFNQYTVSATYSFVGGQKTETLHFQISSATDTLGDGTSTWQWTDSSGTYRCPVVNGSYVFSMTKHQQPGACYVDFGVQYCCTVDSTGTEHCCHVDNHQINEPYAGIPELEQCCHVETSTVEICIDGCYFETVATDYCSYVVNDLPYTWNYNVNGGKDTLFWTKFLSDLWTRLVSSANPSLPTGVLTGQVITSDGKDVTTTLTAYFYPSGEKYKSTNTIGSGNPKSYAFGSLGATTYYIKASAPGYNLYNSSLSITSGQTLVRNITLTPLNQDLCTDDPYKTAPGVCGCGVPDIDSDGDGTADCVDKCPTDPGKTSPGICGCLVSDKDTDKDSTPDCIDDCPDDPAKTDPGFCGCGEPDTDADKNGVPDCRQKWMPNLNLLLREDK